MLEVIHQIKDKDQQELIAHLENYWTHLESDISNYARGRKRFWLKEEPPLSKHGSYKPAVQPYERLNNFLTSICKKAGIKFHFALVAKGEKGIQWHRDAAYAGWKAVSINLGACTWGYCHAYDGYGYEKVQTGPHKFKGNKPVDFYQLELTGGEVLLFNPKNLHKASPNNNDRISINIWEQK